MQFDFLGGQQGGTPSQASSSEAQIAKDQKSVEEMCNVMQYQYIPRDELVFEYESQGDLFYMIIQGRVSCKVPFYKQVVLLSEDEKRLFQGEFGEDLISIAEASELNVHYGLDSSFSQKSSNFQYQVKLNALAYNKRFDLSKMQVLPSVYDKDDEELLKYCERLLQRTKEKVAR